jgi:hypothetical protein
MFRIVTRFATCMPSNRYCTSLDFESCTFASIIHKHALLVFAVILQQVAVASQVTGLASCSCSQEYHSVGPQRRLGLQTFKHWISLLKLEQLHVFAESSRTWTWTWTGFLRSEVSVGPSRSPGKPLSLTALRIRSKIRPWARVQQHTLFLLQKMSAQMLRQCHVAFPSW